MNFLIFMNYKENKKTAEITQIKSFHFSNQSCLSNKSGSFLIRSLLLGFFLALSSCGNNFRGIELSTSEKENSLINNFNLDGEVKNSNEACLSDANSDACIFKISPVTQEGSISPNVTLDSDLSKYQKYAVKIENTSGAGSLENNTIKLLADGKALNKTSGGNWKYEYKDKESGLKILQVHNYFHINEIIKTFNKIGGDLGIRQQIPIEVHASVDCNAYFDPNKQEIMIGTCENTSLAFDADTAMHEFGHAVFDNVSGGATSNVGTKTCDAKEKVKNGSGTEFFMQKCRDENHSYYIFSDTSGRKLGGFISCSTEKACIYGIHEGQADFHVFMLEPNLAGLGATAGPALTDGSSAYLRKNPSTNANLKMSDLGTYKFYDLNGNLIEIKYEVHDVGEIASSVFFGVYTSPPQNTTSEDFIKIFNELQKGLNGKDTFDTMLCKIKAIDSSLFGGKYLEQFSAQYRAHGLTSSCLSSGGGQATPTPASTATPNPTATPTTNPTATPTPTATPNNQDPLGNIDGVHENVVFGWALDLKVPSTSIEVHIYRNGTYYDKITADKKRVDVNDAFKVTGQHGFEKSGLPSGDYSFYAINSNGKGPNPLIGKRTLASTQMSGNFNGNTITVNNVENKTILGCIEFDHRTSPATNSRYWCLSHSSPLPLGSGQWSYNSASKTLSFSNIDSITPSCSESGISQNKMVTATNYFKYSDSSDWIYYIKMYIPCK